MDTSISLERIINRVIGVLKFDRRTFSEIASDPGATTEAAIVVAAVAIASGLGYLFSGPLGLIGGVLSMLIGWVVGAIVIYLVGKYVTGSPGMVSSVERVARSVGYAAAPNIFSFLTGIWLVGWLIGIGIWFWSLVALVLAIRASLSMGTQRAVVTAIIAWLAMLLTTGIVMLIFGINVNAPF